MVDHPEIDEINQRLKPLYRELRLFDIPCPFVVDPPAAKSVALSHYSAGRDATYVQVSRKWEGKLPLTDLAVTIRYAPSVEGTTIIYDLLDETMQGKARPFVCDMTRRFVRPYMLLPFQIERTSVAVLGKGESRVVEIAFMDARDEIIQAALPFELRVNDSRGKLQTSTYTATNRNGRLRHDLAPQTTNIVVRSCLTGREDTLTL